MHHDVRQLLLVAALPWGSGCLTTAVVPPPVALTEQRSVETCRPSPPKQPSVEELTERSPEPTATPASMEVPWIPLPTTEPPSGKLPSGLSSPMPGGLLSGYSADTGLDISGFRMPVYAIAAGTLDYAETGHTRWTSKNDSPYTLRLKLDQPIPWRGHQITHAYYGHLSALDMQVHEGQTPRIHVEAGQHLGVSGWANGSPHLHLGLLLDEHVEQDRWAFILDESEVREALQTGPNGRRLSKEKR